MTYFADVRMGSRGTRRPCYIWPRRVPEAIFATARASYYHSHPDYIDVAGEFAGFLQLLGVT